MCCESLSRQTLYSAVLAVVSHYSYYIIFGHIVVVFVVLDVLPKFLAFLHALRQAARVGATACRGLIYANTPNTGFARLHTHTPATIHTITLKCVRVLICCIFVAHVRVVAY